MWSKPFIVVVLMAGLAVAMAAGAESVGDRLQKGIYQEETVGDLDAAMKIYRQIVADEKANRPHVAQAKYRLGMCYLKRGQKPEAAGAFQQLVEQFPDQTDLLAQARARLSELGKPVSATVVRKLWDSPLESWFTGAPSPDGKYVSYTDWSTGSLAVHEFGTGENRVLAKGSWDEGETAYGSIFSPDGKQLAYLWWKDEAFELRIIELAGAEPRLVYRPEHLRYIQPADWSPDGKHILVLLATRSTSEIALVAVEDGSVRVLKTPNGRARKHEKHMRFSPDGRYIAYSERPNGDTQQHDIRLLAVDGTSDTPLVEHPADDFVLGWAPDGRRLVFASRRNGPIGVWTIDLADGKPRGEPQVVDLQIGPLFSPLGLTRDGSLYYNVHSGWAGVLVAELDPHTGKIVKSPARAFQEFESFDYLTPEWSADGRYLVSRSERPGVGTVLCIRDMQTGKVRVLVPTEENINMNVLDWSPDRRSLLGVRLDSGLIQIDVETGEVKRLTEKGFWPVWDKTGKAVFYVVDRKRIVQRNLESGEERMLYESSGDVVTGGLGGLMFTHLDKDNDGKLTRDEIDHARERPRKRLRAAADKGDGVITREEFAEFWKQHYPKQYGINYLAASPDGRLLAFYEDAMLKVLPTQGGEPRELKEASFPAGRGIAWAPDGRHLFFGRGELWRVPVEGGEPLKTELSLSPEVYQFAVHPDGRQIAYVAEVREAKNEIWVMENFLPEPKPEKASGMAVRRVWAGAADPYFMGAPSPDGKYLSYVDWNTGDLAVRELRTGKNRRLTNEGWKKGFACNSVFSPDGKQVAYYWWDNEKEAELRIVAIDGSGDHAVNLDEETAFSGPAGWSADGKHILAFGGTTDKRLQILLVSVADGSVRVLKTLGKKRRGSERTAELSPDGRYVAYTFLSSDDSASRDISVLAVDGSRDTRLVEHPADDFVLGWTPDGKAVVFASDRTDTMGIWAIEVAEGKPRGAPKLLKPEVGRLHPLGFAQNGSYYYGVFSGGSNIYVAAFDPQKGNVTGEPALAIQRHWGSNWAPAWSPDGRYLACVSSNLDAAGKRGEGRVAAPYHFLIRSMETGEVREFSPELGDFDVHSLSWFPDGRSLLGAGRAEDEPLGGILKIDIETGNVTTIGTKGGRFPNAAPDGKTVFDVHGGRNGWGIYRHDLTTGEKKVLFRASVGQGGVGAILGLALSPDGKQLAFEDLDAGMLKLLLVDGGQPRELAKVEGKISITWTPDGRQLVYTNGWSTAGPVQLWRIRAEGGEPQRLDLEMPYLEHVRFHPDGRQIAFVGKPEGNKCEVWALENFLPKLEATQ